MSNAKVWNRNVHPHTEDFKGEKIHIPAGGYIVMDWLEAKEFAGQFKTPTKLGDDTPDPRGYKMIHVDPPEKPIFIDDSLVCHADGKKAATAEDLATLLKSVALLRPESVAEPTDPQAPSYADLLERLAALESRVGAKKKLGRPFKKEAVG